MSRVSIFRQNFLCMRTRSHGFAETTRPRNLTLSLIHLSFLYVSTFLPQPISADDWNLRKPLQQCSLRVERRGDVLLVVFTYQKEGMKGSRLFALTKVDLVHSNYPMEHYVRPVADSSRYFAVRVTDEKGGREAVVGLGFRERDEAADFVQCLHNYQSAIAREKQNKGMRMMGAGGAGQQQYAVSR